MPVWFSPVACACDGFSVKSVQSREVGMLLRLPHRQLLLLLGAC